MHPTVISTARLAAYSPANHTGTSNVRVIGPETVGATALEVLVGTIARSHGAKPHAHPFLEQCAYMLEGTGESQAQGRTDAMPPGSWGYVPAGVFHTFRVTSDEPG
ncbi:MAG TPA: cupin domain-containing protein, partial [Burkholderiaceae bacterium]|nr:cupin domain-containing protein [Burkholderiaceae bacterium]